MENISVKIDGKKVVCEKGITYFELAKQTGHSDALVVKVDGVVKELGKTVESGNHITFCDFQDKDGRRVYVRGLTMVMLKAFYKETPKDKFEKISVEYSIDTGYYCTLRGVEVTDELLACVSDRMKRYIDEDVTFEKKTMSVHKAIRLFDAKKMFDKSRLLRYRRSSRVTIHKLGKVMDYFYGPMPYSTGCLSKFKLQAFESGFVLIVPKEDDPKHIPEFVPSYKLFHTLEKTAKRGVQLEVENVGQLNDVIVNGGMRDLMLVQEALHEKEIGNIAEQIASSKEVRVVTIAGPSSSGKTTFSYRLVGAVKDIWSETASDWTR